MIESDDPPSPTSPGSLSLGTSPMSGILHRQNSLSRPQRPHPLPSSIPHNLLPSAPASPPTPAPSPTPHERAPTWNNAGEDEDAFLRDARAHFSTLDTSERQRLLAELLNQCTTPQLSFVQNFVTPRLLKDPFAYLPSEICLRVLSFVDDVRTLARASQVSKLWRELLSDDMAWKLMCEKHAYRRMSDDAATAAEMDQSYSDTIASVVSLRPAPIPHFSRPTPGSSSRVFGGLVGSSSSDANFGARSFDGATSSRTGARPRPATVSYKSHFKHRYMVETAWRHGGRVVSHHITPDQGVVTSLHLTPRYIVVALDNAKIHVFDPEGTHLRTLTGHVMGVWAMIPWGDILVSGGCDRDVRVWDMSTGESKYVLKGHTSTVRCLKMAQNGLAVSGSRDTTLRVWDIRTGLCRHILVGHSASVRCLEVGGDLIVSGSYDTTARIWSISEGRCLRVLVGHFSQIYAVAFDGTRIATGSLDTSVRIWEPRTGQCIGVLQGHTSLVGHLQMRGETLVTGGSDGSVRVWSLRDMAPIHRLAAHDNSVTSLQFDDVRVVSGGSDGRVKIWDLKSGHMVRELSTPADAVWRVAFEGDKAVIMASRAGRTIMEVWSFSPQDEPSSSTMHEARSSSPASCPETIMAGHEGKVVGGVSGGGDADGDTRMSDLPEPTTPRQGNSKRTTNNNI
ncbi:MAG: hypothetical protein M1816_003479 [Peltula sp. TS41687]|nr:MAG: hypothetical protein M1816_003479 [Peltula sp. TS41687]